MIKVEFTKDWAIFKKGDVSSFSSELASSIVRKRKVAKYYKAKRKTK